MTDAHRASAPATDGWDAPWSSYQASRYTRVRGAEGNRPDDGAMAETSESLSAAGYTRESVEAYKKAAAEERQRIEAGIAAARDRAELARARLAWLDGLDDLDGPDGLDAAAVENRHPVGDGVDEIDGRQHEAPRRAGPSVEFG